MATEVLRVLIVDDEPLAIDRLQRLCERLPEVEVVGSAADGPQALEQVSRLAPDVVLLDIAMPGLDGIGVAETLAQMGAQTLVIYCTAFDRFAVAAFGVAAVDYLLKPIEGDALARAMSRVALRLASKAEAVKPETFIETFWVPRGPDMVRVSAGTIDRIDAERDYMALQVGPKRFLLHMTFGELERRLDPAQFIRLHRSTMVRRDGVTRLRHDGLGVWYACLEDGSEVRIGRTYLAGAKAMLG